MMKKLKKIIMLSAFITTICLLTGAFMGCAETNENGSKKNPPSISPSESENTTGGIDGEMTKIETEVEATDEETTYPGGEEVGGDLDLSPYGRILVVIEQKQSIKLHKYTASDFSEIGCVHVADLSTGAGKWVKIAQDIKDGKDSIDNYPKNKHDYINRILNDYNQILCLYVEATTDAELKELCAQLKTRADIISAAPDAIISID